MPTKYQVYVENVTLKFCLEADIEEKTNPG